MSTGDPAGDSNRPPLMVPVSPTLRDVAGAAGHPVGDVAKALYDRWKLLVSADEPLNEEHKAALGEHLGVRIVCRTAGPVEGAGAQGPEPGPEPEREIDPEPVELGQPAERLATEPTEGSALGVLAEALDLEALCQRLDEIELEFDLASEDINRKTERVLAELKERHALLESGLREKTALEITAEESRISSIKSRRDKLVKKIGERVGDAKRRVQLHTYTSRELPGWIAPPLASNRATVSLSLPSSWKEAEAAGEAAIEEQVRLAHYLDKEIARRQQALASMKKYMGWVIGLGVLCFFVYLIPTAVMVGFLCVQAMHHMAIRDAIIVLRTTENNLDAIGESWIDWANQRTATEIQAATKELSDSTQRAKAIEGKGILQAAEEAGKAQQAALLELEEASRLLSETRQADLDKTNATVSAWSREIRQKALKLERTYAGARWTDPIWDSWTPAVTSSEDMGLGTWVVDTPAFQKWNPGEEAITVPALLPFLRSKPLFINRGESLGEALSLAKSLALRLLATHPPGAFRLTIVDPIASGQNAAALLALQELDDRLVSGKVWTEVQDIEAQLGELQSHVERVIRRLGEDFATIAELNDSSDVDEPYKLLIVYDFPQELSDVSLRRLQKLLRNGPRCGVQTVLIRDSMKALPAGHVEADFEHLCHVIGGGRFNEPPMSRAELRAPDAPSRDRVGKILSVVGTASRERTPS